jgi:elongator complex protein 2
LRLLDFRVNIPNLFFKTTTNLFHIMTTDGKPQLEFVAAGGNRHPSAADWAPGLLAFGAGINIALWNPDNSRANGVSALLAGHTEVVNAVKILDLNYGKRFIISGASDNSVRVWRQNSDGSAFPFFEESQCLTGHTGAVNTISVLPGSNVFATGAADGTVRVWRLGEGEAQAELVQAITLKPRLMPLATALAQLPSGEIVLAVAGTIINVQIYVQTASGFELQATLSGHEGWVRSLDFLTRAGEDLLLASASQDKYVRLWRFKNDDQAGAAVQGIQPVKKSLSNKAHQVGSGENQYAITFEALLVGHEDWIYSARWGPLSGKDDTPTLLTASADNSLSLWSVEEASGLWVCQTRLGEISQQKGSTTATGSTGGFWIGMWQPERQAVVSLGRTGSWRRWAYDSGSDMWLQQLGVSGHVQEVQSVAWAPDGSYLLSTGLDQTTRLFAEWKRDGIKSWHEIARPQIHGYDLNCLATLTPHQFVSGAEEKLLRVFDKPKATQALLSALSGNTTISNEDLALPEAANIPVLGLSNKAITVADEEATEDSPAAPEDAPHNSTTWSGVPTASSSTNPSTATPSLSTPPVEDHLARATLWPEHEKLYGHGYEISCVAANAAGTLVATACKASSLDHAVIRLYETKEWREIKPPLSAHTLTVTSLAFSPDDRFLLSVGRDRQWVLFQSDASASGQDADAATPPTYTLLKANPKGHSRMILDCAWAPSATPSPDGGFGTSIFATAGRDKTVKLWSVAQTPSSTGDNRSEVQVDLIKSLPTEAPVTALAFSPDSLLAYGTDQGRIGFIKATAGKWEEAVAEPLWKELGPAKAVTCLAWRPGKAEEGEDGGRRLLAVSSEDCGMRLVRV